MSFHDPMTDHANLQTALPRQATKPVYDARRLVDGEGTALIVLDDKTYSLRITRAGKLILTK